MATTKKTAKKAAKKTTGKTAGTSAPKAAKRGAPRQEAEGLSHSLSESAQHIWLAGVGAFGRAQAEGTKLFEGLVKEGVTLEKHARKFAGNQAEVVRDVVESKVGQARERAADTWDRMEKLLEERVHKVLAKLDVPARSDVSNLARRVDGLANEVRRASGTGAKTARATKAAKAPVARKAAARKAATKKPASAAVKKPVAKKATRKPAATPRVRAGK